MDTIILKYSTAHLFHIYFECIFVRKICHQFLKLVKIKFTQIFSVQYTNTIILFTSIFLHKHYYIWSQPVKFSTHSDGKWRWMIWKILDEVEKINGKAMIRKSQQQTILCALLRKDYLEQAIDGIRNLWRKRCIQYVHVFSKPGDNTTNRSRIKEGQWSTHHSTQHHYVHLTSSQPTAQLRCQIAEKARHRYNIRHG